MGRISAPFGVRGWVRVRPDTETPQSLLAYKSWWVESATGWSEIAVAEAKVQGEAVVARLEGCSDRDGAAAYRGAMVAVPRAALPEARSGEYYWADLIGLRVKNVAEQDLGEVSGMLQTGANDVLVVQGSRERLIPFIAGVVRGVDTGAGVLSVDWDADY